MEKDKQAKGKFFAQYWGQRILGWLDWDNTENGRRFEVNGKYYRRGFLELTPLSQITDKDAIEVARICDFVSFPEEYICVRTEKYISVNHQYNDHQDEFDCFRIYNEFEIFSINEEGNTFEYDAQRTLNVIDFLRGKGYALPYLGMQIDELVDLGWIRQKTNV